MLRCKPRSRPSTFFCLQPSLPTLAPVHLHSITITYSVQGDGLNSEWASGGQAPWMAIKWPWALAMMWSSFDGCLWR